MNEPRRLSRSGGVSQRLLDSASIDKPSEAARRRAAEFAGTAGAFVSSASAETSPARSKPKRLKTFVTWIAIGAAASVVLAVLGSQLLPSLARAPSAASGSSKGMAELPTVPMRALPRNPDISAEKTTAPAPATLSSVRPTPSASSSPPTNASGIVAPPKPPRLRSSSK